MVFWEPQLCIHTARCLMALPEVFNANRRPWVKIDGASPDHIAAAVMGCPSGALRFERLDGGMQELGSETTRIEALPDGPLYVQGKLEIQDTDGNLRRATRAALCRCGRSGNKPYCDNSHLHTGFSTTGRLR